MPNVSTDSMLTTAASNSTYVTSIPTLSPDTQNEIKNLISATQFLQKYYIWIVFAFGFPGNTVSLIVIGRLLRQRLNTSLFYVALLAFVDNVAIILKIVNTYSLSRAFWIDDTGCQLLHFFGLIFAAYANWILIVFSSERFTAVWFPLKVGLIWSFKKACGVIVGIFVFLCLVHVHLFFTVRSNDQQHYSCGVREEYEPYMYPLWYFVSSAIFSFIPATCVTVLNILIVLKVKKSALQRESLMSKPDSQRSESRNNERQVTVMLITIAVLFIVLTLPSCIFVLSYPYWIPTHPLGIARQNFFNRFTSIVADTNHAINFYLYFLSGRRFRTIVMDTFYCKKKNTYTPVSNNGNTQMSDVPVANTGM